MTLRGHTDATQRRARTGIALFFIVAGLLVTSCGGGGGGNDAYGERGAVVAQSSSITVHMKDIQFQPKGIRVKPGTTVTWVNDDRVLHNVRQVESVFLSPDVMKHGDIFNYNFDKPGTYRYVCTYHHPKMNGVVIVEE